jgi:drug/metabolite transporter (DMT)-like permease
VQGYRSLVRVLTLALLWGSGFFWIKMSLRGFTPSQMLLARLALGAVALIVVLYSRGDRLPAGRRRWLHLGGAAVFGNVIPYLLFAVAERQVDSSVAGMLNATTPLWTLVIAFAAGQTPTLRARQLVGVALGLVGTVLIFAPWNAGTQFTSSGAVLCLAAALSYGISYVYIGRFLSEAGTSPLALSAGQLLAASVLALLTLPLFDGLRPPEWRADAITSLIILGVIGTGLAYVINYRIIHDDGPVAASLVLYLLPVVAVALGAAFLHEELTAHALLGVLVVIVGVAAARQLPSRKEHAANQAPASVGR